MLIIRQPPAFHYLPQKWSVHIHNLMPIFMFAINTMYQFLLFTLSCILCIPFIFCFNCNFVERRKQIQNSMLFIYLINWNDIIEFGIEEIVDPGSKYFSVDFRTNDKHEHVAARPHMDFHVIHYSGKKI